MPTLEWSGALALELPQMDHTHEEFVDLLAAVQQAGDDHIVAAWHELIVHTDEHFGQEDRWMRDTRFASANCHSTQHAVVLQVMREGERTGDPAMIRTMASELAAWFPQHLQTMDAALALHLRRVGYDVGSGDVAVPAALPVQEIRGCGSASCSPH